MMYTVRINNRMDKPVGTCYLESVQGKIDNIVYGGNIDTIEVTVFDIGDFNLGIESDSLNDDIRFEDYTLVDSMGERFLLSKSTRSFGTTGSSGNVGTSGTSGPSGLMVKQPTTSKKLKLIEDVIKISDSNGTPFFNIEYLKKKILNM